jgi:Na+-translocating ferredoxin:NAD+ oxidoreductase subunit G
MSELQKNMVRSAIVLMLFAIAGTALVAFTYDAARDRIAENERKALLHSLHEVISPGMHNNDIFADTTRILDPALLGSNEPVTVYRARKDHQPVAAVFTSIAPDGYNGTIKLLIGIDIHGTLLGVRVLSQRETPGLGDAIETDRSDWILGFRGKSLQDPDYKHWKVKKDGGVFDQFTGATITPRAVVKAIRNTLVYFRNHQERVFAEAPTKKPPETGKP